MIKLLAFGFIFANALKLILFKIAVFNGLADWRETKLSPKSSFAQNQNIFHFKPKIILKNSRALFHFYMRSKKYTVKNNWKWDFKMVVAIQQRSLAQVWLYSRSSEKLCYQSKERQLFSLFTEVIFRKNAPICHNHYVNLA